MNITNFRDLGGYETTSGKRVKHGFFYRSSPIIFQNDNDRKEFSNLHMKTILDFRSDVEAEKAPDEVVDGCSYIHCSAISLDMVENGDGDFDIASLMQSGKLQDLVHYVEHVYTLLPFENLAYQGLFDLMRAGETPLVFHCSAGKDRTGFAAYLILKTLGVPDETIMQDYMLSNVYRKEENEKFLALSGKTDGASELLYVQEKYLQSSIDGIMEKYGDFETYVREEYDVTADEIEQWREKYLE